MRNSAATRVGGAPLFTAAAAAHARVHGPQVCWEEEEELCQELMQRWQCESKRGEPDGCLLTRSLLLTSVTATSGCSANWPSQPHQLGNARHHTLRLSLNPEWITYKVRFRNKESLNSSSLTNGPFLCATLQLGGDIIYSKGNSWRPLNITSWLAFMANPCSQNSPEFVSLFHSWRDCLWNPEPDRRTSVPRQ